ncbi:6-pyruvoyl-tetrahydropterin synthase-related protein [Leptothoe kymatousa]|uniref:Membrane protein 6-pyruvoyl-tetrahydropterin synthase-related domain-containing protein n=1 Tax=Leptothoe kymatousa TAU-MAC 1615 TaxID=2364775 RepID=A0ABS5XZ50_9CYAN|nr:6-pyruvoyl-tetrahydropterin synthase-related protein [Leptothoe kymatousa]MBT9310880.1 hypothetical protein [Leptothoe kymatousa TAU-MAC 1615]
MTSVSTRRFPFSDSTAFQPYVWNVAVIVSLMAMTIIINIQMIRYGLTSLGDIKWHIAWVQHFSQQLAEGIWYPRWIAGTNFGYGSPTFVFYPPFVYYIGSFLKFIGFKSEATMTLLFSLPLFLSGLSFYLYGRSKWGKLPGLLGAIFYMNTPVFISAISFGNLSTLWAYPWIPLGMYWVDRSFVKPQARIAVSLMAAVVALTHTPSLLLYAIAWFIYLLFSLLDKPFKAVFLTFAHGVLGFCMAAFYLVPAILEQKFVNLDYQLGSKGGFLMLQISDLFKDGWSDILVKNLVAIVVFLGLCLYAARQNKQEIRTTLLWAGFAFMVFFMVCNWSEPIWRSSHILLKVQRSTRALVLFYFGQAVICSLAVRAALKLHWRLKIVGSMLLLSIVWSNFHFGYTLSRQAPGLHSPTNGVVHIREWLETALNDPYSNGLIDVPEYRPLLSDAAFDPDIRERYVGGTPVPYIEGGEAYFPVPSLNQQEFSIVEGDADITLEQWGAYNRQFEVTATQPSTLRVRTYFYPAWRLWVNQKQHPIRMADDGRIEFDIDAGVSRATLQYHHTNTFIFGLIVSSASLLLLLATALKIYGLPLGLGILPISKGG